MRLNQGRPRTPKTVVALVATLTLGVLFVLAFNDWSVPVDQAQSFWNAVAAFTLLGIASDSAFINISRASIVGISGSVVFVPLLAGVLLFPEPWPMVIAGVTALVVEAFVQRKPGIRVWFNTAQYMLSIGIGGMVYKYLGGHVGGAFEFSFLPFIGLVLTYFALNTGSVSLVVALTSGVPLRETWTRIVGGSLPYDLVASGLAVLLSFLYTHLQLLGLAILVIPLFLLRHMYQETLQKERVNQELLHLMVKAIEARDPYTSGHSLRVSEYAQAIARELGLSAKLLDQISNAALLHDVGKIYEEFAPLLRKEGKLTLDERMVMQKHPLRSAELAATIGEFRGPVEAAIRFHHENYDGSGYPHGLAGRAIPVGARIIMIADTIDAMTTDRPYRKALSFARTMEELRKYSGTQFDPELVEVVARSAAVRRLLGPRVISTEVTDPSQPRRVARV